MYQAASEVENLKSQMITLFKELQQAQSKLDEAEGMKKNLQDRLDPHMTHNTHDYIINCKDFSKKSNQNYTSLPVICRIMSPPIFVLILYY